MFLPLCGLSVGPWSMFARCRRGASIACSDFLLAARDSFSSPRRRRPSLVSPSADVLLTRRASAVAHSSRRPDEGPRFETRIRRILSVIPELLERHSWKSGASGSCHAHTRPSCAPRRRCAGVVGASIITAFAILQRSPGFIIPPAPPALLCSPDQRPRAGPGQASTGSRESGVGSL